MKVYNYTVIFEPVEKGGYDVIVPAIPEICTFGESLEEAKAMAEDAIKCYLESALQAGEAIPEDKEPSGERIAVRMQYVEPSQSPYNTKRPELRVTVPVHNKDVPERTLRRILKQQI